jgi:hypothetical protein
MACACCGLRTTVPGSRIDAASPSGAKPGHGVIGPASVPAHASRSRVFTVMSVLEAIRFRWGISAGLSAAALLTLLLLARLTIRAVVPPPSLTSEKLIPVADAAAAESMPVVPPRSVVPLHDQPVAICEVELAGRSEDELLMALRPLVDEFSEVAAGAVADLNAERRAAFIRLRMYRRLCGVPDANMELSEQLNDESLAAADICRHVGRLTHDPPNPGKSAEEYAKAHRGASSGNLAYGISDLVRAVDGWMDDSDADNVAVLGHRRWCLNPPMRLVGFGRADRYTAMWAHDTSAPDSLISAAVCFPPPGAVPIDLFRPTFAWSISLNPRMFRQPLRSKVSIEMREVRGHADLGPVWDLGLMHVDTKGFGIGNCIIFRPVDISTAVGMSYQVTVGGIHDHEGRDARIRFVTTFTPAINGGDAVSPDAR